MRARVLWGANALEHVQLKWTQFCLDRGVRDRAGGERSAMPVHRASSPTYPGARRGQTLSGRAHFIKPPRALSCPYRQVRPAPNPLISDEMCHVRMVPSQLNVL